MPAAARSLQLPAADPLAEGPGDAPGAIRFAAGGPVAALHDELRDRLAPDDFWMPDHRPRKSERVATFLSRSAGVGALCVAYAATAWLLFG